MYEGGWEEGRESGEWRKGEAGQSIKENEKQRRGTHLQPHHRHLVDRIQLLDIMTTRKYRDAHEPIRIHTMSDIRIIQAQLVRSKRPGLV